MTPSTQSCTHPYWSGGRGKTYDTRYSHQGSGNVLRDLGFSEEKSAEMILKSSQLQAIQETIKGWGWKQIEAVTQLGNDQAKVSKLLAGQMSGFSIERLVHFLSLLGQDVEVTVRKASRGRRRGTVRTKISGKIEEVAR